MAIVYRHRRLDTNNIFYIGIGKTVKRAYSKHGRSSWWTKVTSKTDYSVDIISYDLTWEDACELEILLISQYGRCDLGLGLLVNMTDGGEGVLGYIPSDETKNKISLAKKGVKTKRVYKPLSDITKNKISINGKKIIKKEFTLKGKIFELKTLILNVENGIFHNSITEASNTYNIKRTTLNAMLSGQNKNKTNLIRI